MPKKWAAENTKAVSAKQRKAMAQAEEAERKRVAAEDEYWRDDDKRINKKNQRKEDKDRKRQDQLEKKAEKAALLEKEEHELKSQPKIPQAKITHAQIVAETEKRALVAMGETKEKEQVKNVTHLQQPLEENVNHLVVEGEEARSVEEAISILSVKDDSVKHPERKLKAAFAAFEEERLPQLKAENPNMRMTQLQQLLRKEWVKSPSNPVNQAR